MKHIPKLMLLAWGIIFVAGCTASHTYQPIKVPELGLTLVSVPAKDNSVSQLWVQTTEVTVKQFHQFLLEAGRREYLDHGATNIFASDNSILCNQQWPVTHITWYGANDFCSWLTKKVSSLNRLPHNLVFHLPSRAEWNRVSIQPNKAGNISRVDLFDDYVWHSDNSLLLLHEVGLKKANSLGIHDIFGNAAEWTDEIMGRTNVNGVSMPSLIIAGGDFASTIDEMDPRVGMLINQGGEGVGFRIYGSLKGTRQAVP